MDLPTHFSNDITNGDEQTLFPIPGVNEIDDEKLADGYIYVNSNIDTDHIYTEEDNVKFMNNFLQLKNFIIEEIFNYPFSYIRVYFKKLLFKKKCLNNFTLKVFLFTIF